MEGVPHLMAGPLYGSGLRLMACVRSRVKDADLETNQITAHDGKGEKDRAAMLPRNLKEPLQRQRERARRLFERELAAGHADVLANVPPPGRLIAR